MVDILNTAISAIADSPELSAQWSEGQRAQFQRMRNIMEREQGLLNIPQAALLLDVSRERIRELMKLGILSRHEFLGHIYLSFREVNERRAQDVKAGRPPRSVLQRLKTGLHAVALTDKLQARQGGFPGSHAKSQSSRKKKPRKK